MEGNNVRSFENLCKIFEMRIKLDREKKVKTPSDVLINYEKYAKKIDNIYNEEFEKEVRPLITPSKTIEEEKDRLEKLNETAKRQITILTSDNNIIGITKLDNQKLIEGANE